MSQLLASRKAIRIRKEGNIGTICRRQPCVLCDRPFDIQSGDRILVARDQNGDRMGVVCPRCARSSEEALKRGMAQRAERLRERAERLERWSEGRIETPPADDTSEDPRGVL